MIDKILPHVIALDDARDHNGLLSFLQGRGLNADEAGALFGALFDGQRLAACYVVAVVALGAGIEDVSFRMVEFLGSLVFGNAMRCDGALDRVRALLARRPDQRPWVRETFEPVVARLAMSLQEAGADPKVMRLLDLWMAVSPAVAAAFGPGPVADVPVAAPLYQPPAPPLDRRVRRAVVAVRRLLYFLKPGSREHDLGPRLVQAMRAYGWDTRFMALDTINTGPLLDAEYARLARLCRDGETDVLVLDEFLDNEHTEACVAEIRRLRAERPDIKVVAVYFDPWSLDPQAIIRAARHVDCVWCLFPSMAVFAHPQMAGKVFMGTYPMGVAPGSPAVPLGKALSFIGGVQLYNWHRAFWLAAARMRGILVETRLSSHAHDGLAVLDSYAQYIRRLEQAGCCLNFSMRLNESRILTGRAFEAIHAGALLVQEATEDIAPYFTAGEHYLSFTTLGQLAEIAEMIAERPDEAQAIRQRGFDFFRQRYCDQRAMAALDGWLFG